MTASFLFLAHLSHSDKVSFFDRSSSVYLVFNIAKNFESWEIFQDSQGPSRPRILGRSDFSLKDN